MQKKRVNLAPNIQHRIFQVISEVAAGQFPETYVIGGYVRDILLERPSNDIDIVSCGNGIELARKVSERLGLQEPTVFKNFGTAHFRFDNLDIEFVGARKESYRSDSRNPSVENGTTEDDQKRRDFTINAMAIDLHPDRFGELSDPFHGIEDLRNRIIRTPLDPGLTFSDDPLRMMRAIRFACQLSFRIDEETYQAIQDHKARIRIVSEERITEELNKIILSAKPSVGFELLDDCGILAEIFPQLSALKGVDVVDKVGHKDNFYHTLGVLDKLSGRTNNLWLRWAALLHDIAKPLTKKFVPGAGWTFHGHEVKGSRMAADIFRSMRLPLNEKLKYVQKLVLLHLRPTVLAEEGVTDSAVRRLLFEAGEDIDDLMMLCEADITSGNRKKVERILRNFEHVRQRLAETEEKDRLRNWQPPIGGDQIMTAFGIGPGREVGIIKTAIREAILDGNISNNYDEAYQLMIEEGKKLGLVKKV